MKQSKHPLFALYYLTAGYSNLPSFIGKPESQCILQVFSKVHLLTLHSLNTDLYNLRVYSVLLLAFCKILFQVTTIKVLYSSKPCQR